MGHAAAGIIPQSMMIEFEQAAQGSEKPFEMMIRWAEHTQTKAITGNLPGNEKGTGSGIGSGMADLANEVRKEICDSDAKQLAGTITKQLIYPLLAINKGWADPRRCPRFQFDIAEGEDIKLYAESLPKLVGIGMRIPPDWAHDKLRIPQAGDNDPVLATAPAPAAKPNETPPAKLAALQASVIAALQASTKQEEFADQAAIDAAMAAATQDLQPITERWLAPMMAALRDKGDPAQALELLSSQNPFVSEEILAEALARVMFVCELVGWDAVQGELNGNA